MAESGSGRDGIGIGLNMKLGSDPNAFIYTTALVLNNSTSYSLEFWTRSQSGDPTNTLRYGIYDKANGMYLQPEGTWSGNEQIFDSFVMDTGSYQKVVKNFRTLPTDVGQMELRFYMPGTGGVYLDDVAIAEAKDFTVNMWLQTYGCAPDTTALFLRQFNSDATTGLDWSAQGKTVTLAAYSDGYEILPTLTIPDGNWHMLTFVANRSGNYTVYLDGQFDQEANFSIGTLNNSELLTLGARGDGASPSFNGSIDDVRIYQRALSAGDVEMLYRGKTQDACQFSLTASYDDSNGLLARELEVDYNAALKVRKHLPDETLAMPFDFNTTSTARGAVIDYSPYGAHGTIYSPDLLAWTNDCRIGGCYQFNGGGYIQEPAGLYEFGLNNFTISFWVRGQPAVDEALVSKGAWGASDGWMVYTSSSGPDNWYYWNGVASAAMGATSDRWVQYVIVRNTTIKGGLSIYQNGILVTTYEDRTNHNSGLPLTIGGTADADPTFFMDGAGIDELRIFNRSLTASEVRGLYMDYSKVYDGPLVASKD
ncbi:MAG: LamG domain-containing protein [Candidatus Micrarchaeota archaeon]|nr:LamG domain-containing protein [Candidatus Micrarchaeota archaeon]